MAGSVARLGGRSTGDGLPPADIYKIAVEEYRFQAQFNWSRTQYLLGFNALVLAAALALVEQSGPGAALVFVVGFVAALLSVLVVRTQHGYYRAARDHMKGVEERYGLPSADRLTTTSSMGGGQRSVSVNQVVYLLLGLIAVSNAVGAVIALAR